MVSIVVVNWNSGALLGACVRSLLESAPGSEIIVVDNASDDSSLEPLSREAPRIVLLRQERNLGFAAGANVGWRRSRGSAVLFLNPDTECRPGSVRSLADTLQSDPGIWAAGGHLVDSGGETQAQYGTRSFPTVGSVAAEMLFLDELWPSNPWTLRYRPGALPPGEARDVDQPAGACLMVRRDKLELLNGFDERFERAWFEDVDLCRRIRSRGGRIVFQPQARFLHRGGYSLDRLAPVEFLRSFHTNQLRYFAKHDGHRSAHRVRRWVLTGLYLRAALSFLRPANRSRSRLQSAGAFWRAARSLPRPREVLP